MNWRKTSIYASAFLAGGLAVYYSYLQKPKTMQQHQSTGSKQTDPPHSIPKHPSRLFKQPIDVSNALQYCQRAITENEYSFTIPELNQSSLHIVNVASNEPFEDRHSHHLFKHDDKLMAIFGVFDGHSGHECSDVLRRFAHNYVAEYVWKEGKRMGYAKAIEEALSNLDNELLRVALDTQYNLKEAAVVPALAGSVSNVACIVDDYVITANTGDVRTVIATQTNKGIIAEALTKDHNADNPEEVARMLAEHPGESKEVLLHRKRVLGGLMPTRAFGDASYKWTREEIENLSKQLLSNNLGSVAKRIRPISASKTPPYVTARPEMSERKLSENDLFIIIATDGLWDEVTNQEAVNYVSDYLKLSLADQSRENAASYLVRKALSREHDNGKDKLSADQFCAELLAVPPPYSRRFRDDITVQVVFLNRQVDGGENKYVLKSKPFLSNGMETFEKSLTKLAADFMHLASIIILLLKIEKSKSVSGISRKTQILYLVVFCARYLDLFIHFISLYNTLMKLFFIASSAYILYLCEKFRTTYDPQLDTFRIEYLLGFSVGCCLLFHYSWEVIELFWSFSVFLESVSILPQLFMMSRTGEAETITTHYVGALGVYRALYVLNWIYRYVVEGHFDWISSICGLIQTGLYADFFYVYFTRVLKGKKFKLPA